MNGVDKEWRAKTRYALIERDGLICMWCGVALSMRGKHNSNALFPTIEHITPMCNGGARGGPNDLSNLGLACRKCNNTRREKGGDAQCHKIPQEQHHRI